MPENLDVLSGRQARALAELLRCKSLGEAAEKSNVNEKTLSRWVHNDEHFKKAYREATSQALDNSISRLNSAAGTAVDTLVNIMTDPECGRQVKLNAARAVLEFAFKGREMLLLDKLSELERLLKDGEPDPEEVVPYGGD